MTGLSISGRRHFHRKALCEARLEFSRMDDRERILEAYLLTAIGTLGITRGFSCIIHPGTNTATMVSRGVDAGAAASVEKKFHSLNLSYFPGLKTVPYPFHADLCIIGKEDEVPVQLNEAGIRLLTGWRMGNESEGLLGLGSKIISDTYGDDEINFLLNLTDTMMEALRFNEVRNTKQLLNEDLARAENQSADMTLALESVKKELDHTRFRLTGYNDIFNELSGLKGRTNVIDAFLLVLLGIFSAGGGYIFFFDQDRTKSHRTCRGPGMDRFMDQPLRQIQTAVETAVSATRALQLDPMKAAVLSPQLMDRFKPFLPETDIGLIFRVDESAMGVIGLDDRFTRTPYGAGERELLLAFAKNFLVFLKNSSSFETIQRLNTEQEKRNLKLEETIKELSATRHTILSLEKTGERIKAALLKAMMRSRKASLLDILLILIAGMILGLVYNAASPGGINVIPGTWRRPPSVHVGIDQARQLFETRNALFVDARPTEFFNRRHIPGAENLPPALFDFVYMMRFSQIEPDRPIVVYGRNISRRYDEETAFRLLERGHETVMVFPGDLTAWEKMGLRLEP